MRHTIKNLLAALVIAATSLSCIADDAPPAKQKDATVAYWNSLIRIDEQFMESLKKVVAAMPNEQTAQKEHPFITLTKIGQSVSDLVDKYTKQVGKLPLRNVDDKLIEDTARDLRVGVGMQQHLSGLAESGMALLEWGQRKNKLPDSFLGDLIDSFIMGLQAQPFAGYNKMKKDSQSLDAEGQQLAAKYMSHVEALNKLAKETADDKVKEIELRAFLAKKYDVEFPPRPDLEE